jgi:hypothetical protein
MQHSGFAGKSHVNNLPNADRELGWHARVLGEITNEIAPANRLPRVHPGNADDTGGRFQETQEQADEGGFAPAVGSNDAEGGTAFDRQINPLKDILLAESEIDGGNFDDRGHV